MHLTTDLLEKSGPGLQLAIFETVWPSFPTLDRILADVTPTGELEIRLEWRKLPAPEERESCEYLVTEVVEVAFGPQVSMRFESVAGPSDKISRVLMSEAIFRTIAHEVAPHRLAAGR